MQGAGGAVGLAAVKVRSAFNNGEVALELAAAALAVRIAFAAQPLTAALPGHVVGVAEGDERGESAAGSETKATSRPGIEVLGVHGDPSPGA